MRKVVKVVNCYDDVNLASDKEAGVESTHGLAYCPASADNVAKD